MCGSRRRVLLISHLDSSFLSTQLRLVLRYTSCMPSFRAVSLVRLCFLVVLTGLHQLYTIPPISSTTTAPANIFHASIVGTKGRALFNSDISMHETRAWLDHYRSLPQRCFSIFFAPCPPAYAGDVFRRRFKVQVELQVRSQRGLSHP